MSNLHDLSDKKIRLSSAVVAVVHQIWVTLTVFLFKAGKLKCMAPRVFCANLMHFILRILKFLFLRVVTLEKFFEVLLFRP
jgi:hypothetical protein